MYIRGDQTLCKKLLEWGSRIAAVPFHIASIQFTGSSCIITLQVRRGLQQLVHSKRHKVTVRLCASTGHHLSIDLFNLFTVEIDI